WALSHAAHPAVLSCKQGRAHVIAHLCSERSISRLWFVSELHCHTPSRTRTRRLRTASATLRPPIQRTTCRFALFASAYRHLQPRSCRPANSLCHLISLPKQGRSGSAGSLPPACRHPRSTRARLSRPFAPPSSPARRQLLSRSPPPVQSLSPRLRQTPNVVQGPKRQPSSGVGPTPPLRHLRLRPSYCNLVRRQSLLVTLYPTTPSSATANDIPLRRHSSCHFRPIIAHRVQQESTGPQACLRRWPQTAPSTPAIETIGL
ncbi:uncharacterized protein LAESUDRAFT_816953, partial [Laetiporus sulphureus 93-53]